MRFPPQTKISNKSLAHRLHYNRKDTSLLAIFCTEKRLLPLTTDAALNT